MSQYEDRWSLPRPTTDARLQELRAKAEAELRALGADPKPPHRQDGVDKTGSIRVTVDADGRVEDVEILDDWPEHIEPSDFPKALFEAYAIAVAKSVNARALAKLAAESKSGRVEEEPDVPDDPVESPIKTAEEQERWLADVDARLARMDEMEERALRLDVAEVRERIVRGPGGCLTARHRGNGVVAVSGDPYRIGVSRLDVLRNDAFAVLRARSS